MHNLNISVATQTDQPIILGILKETQQWLWAKSIHQWTLPFEVSWINESIENQEFFIVTIQNETMAVFRLTTNDSIWEDGEWEDRENESIYIHNLAVQHNWRGHGIGEQIIQWIEAFAAENNRSYLRLDCMAENLVLCRYYEQVGFAKCGIRNIQNDDSVYTAQLYEKAVSAHLRNIKKDQPIADKE